MYPKKVHDLTVTEDDLKKSTAFMCLGFRLSYRSGQVNKGVKEEK